MLDTLFVSVCHLCLHFIKDILVGIHHLRSGRSVQLVDREALVALAAKLEVKNSVVLWPLRVAVSGKASTPGGATELCALLGKEESLARIRTGIELLSK